MKFLRLRLRHFFLVLFIASFVGLLFVEGPLKFRRTITDFSSVIPPDLLMEDSWYGVYFQDNFIGYSHFLMQIEERQEGGGYFLKNDLRLKFPILGKVEEIKMDNQINLNVSYQLEEAKFKVNSGNYNFSGKIKRIGPRSYHLQAKTPAQKIDKKIAVDNQLIDSWVGPLSLNYIPPQENLKFSFYDPFTEQSTVVLLTRQGQEIIEVGGQKIKVYRYLMDVQGAQGRVYIDKRGRMVKEEFLGFTFIKEEPTKLINKEVSPQLKDVLQYFAVKSIMIPDKEKLSRLRVVISGIPAEYIHQDFNQKIVAGDNGAVVEVKRHSLDSGDIKLSREDYQKYTSEDKFIKFKDEGVSRVINEVTAETDDPWLILKKFTEWIDNNIQKVPTISLPNTLDTLQIGRGDCNELSALLAGFLRARGIPAYVNIGIVYQDKQFFYHAWVSAYINGTWIDTDPTLNQLIADPTHIKLFKGFKNQFDIFKIINNLDVKILDYNYQEDYVKN
jgi:hypothetical protein